MSKKQHTIRIDVAGLTFFVRHESARQAKAWFADAVLTAERATDDDLIKIGRDGLAVFRPLDPPPVNDDQLGIFQPPADPEEAARAIDAENARNAEFLKQ